MSDALEKEREDRDCWEGEAGVWNRGIKKQRWIGKSFLLKLEGETGFGFFFSRFFFHAMHIKGGGVKTLSVWL